MKLLAIAAAMIALCIPAGWLVGRACGAWLARCFGIETGKI